MRLVVSFMRFLTGGTQMEDNRGVRRYRWANQGINYAW